MASETITQADIDMLDALLDCSGDCDKMLAVIAERSRAAVAELVDALRVIREEARRENGSWLHLKRCIAVQTTAALARHQAGLGKGDERDRPA